MSKKEKSFHSEKREQEEGTAPNVHSQQTFGEEKLMNIGSINQGAVYADYTGNRTDKVTINEDGSGLFPCDGGQGSHLPVQDSKVIIIY